MDIHQLESCTSTNDLALNAVEGKNGETWIAFAQTAGRGRRHKGVRRTWFSPPDSGVYFSILLKPNCKPAQISGLTLVVGAALCESLRSHEIDAWLKWPNDVFVGTKKLAGVLTEGSTSGGMLERIVIGVGINVNMSSDAIPDELLGNVTSMLMETDVPTSIDRLQVALDARRTILEKCDLFFKKDFASLYAYVVRYDESKGIEVETNNGVGRAVGISPSGALEVENEEGMFSVNAGEVRFLFRR